MNASTRMPNPTLERMIEIRANRAKHLAKLRGLWEKSLIAWVSNPRLRDRVARRTGAVSRSKYTPAAEDRKHAVIRYEQSLQ